MCYNIINMKHENMRKLIWERDIRLKTLRTEIEEAISSFHSDVYSYNIISWSLGEIASEYGTLEANRAIIDFDLDELGWKVREVK